MKNPARGFTLVELLIAISIIAILSVIGINAYSAVYKSSRDSQRKSDIKFIQSALEDYYNDLVYYPSGALPFGNALTNCTGVFPACAGITRTYITSIPKGPDPSPQYLYSALPADCDNNTSKCTSYCIYTKLEMSAAVFVGDSVCIDGAGSYNYGLSKP